MTHLMAARDGSHVRADVAATLSLLWTVVLDGCSCEEAQQSKRRRLFSARTDGEETRQMENSVSVPGAFYGIRKCQRVSGVIQIPTVSQGHKYGCMCRWCPHGSMVRRPPAAGEVTCGRTAADQQRANTGPELAGGAFSSRHGSSAKV